MKNVLYIGNALSNSGKTITTIETLSAHLKEVCAIKVASNKSNKVFRLFDMMKLVFSNKSKADYVLIDTYSTTNFYFALIISQLCRLFKLKYIPILHGGNLENRLKSNPKLSRVIFKNAYQLVAPSKFLATIFQSHGYKTIIHIPNSIDMYNYKFANRKIDKIKLLWVRSFSSIYNPELAIEVLKKLKDQGLKSELTMIGPEIDGSLALTKQKAQQYNLEVKFTGKLSKRQWIETAKDFNIFINTTNFDNTPVSIIEAMALGLPIVSTNAGGLPYLISDLEDGLLVPVNNASAMVDAIKLIAANETLRQKLIRNARQKAESFDWNMVKAKWISLLS
ncbi:glycosyltransferase family 4 protein [Winogradskyella sp.]|uniref:glycosyltransferase family 4 protein n=1 Tax=Winogradskyella sp. TaxID=1883156 RepID=UPI003F6CA4BC